MSTIIKIFKNLGTIVILLFQIAYVATIDYIRPYDNAKNTKNKTTPHQYTPIDKVTKSYKRTRRHSMKDEQDESVERNHKMVENLRKNFLI